MRRRAKSTLLTFVFCWNISEGHFVWGGSDEVAHLPWWSYEPDNTGNQDCAVLSDKVWWQSPPEVLPDYLAFDVSCHKYKFPLCEKVKGKYLSKVMKCFQHS